MKRSRDASEVEAQAMANICTKLLSRFDQVAVPTYTAADSRVYQCKTCGRKFSSFQALGGHRTSHKKPKLMTGDDNNLLPVKSKKHECTICGVEFALGQALGGHMRRHRQFMGNSVNEKIPLKVEAVPFLKRCNSSKRVLCLDLDLNLMPYDVDLKLGW